MAIRPVACPVVIHPVARFGPVAIRPVAGPVVIHPVATFGPVAIRPVAYMQEIIENSGETIGKIIDS